MTKSFPPNLNEGTVRAWDSGLSDITGIIESFHLLEIEVSEPEIGPRGWCNQMFATPAPPGNRCSRSKEN